MKIQMLSLGVAIACLTQPSFAQQQSEPQSQPSEAAGKNAGAQQSFQASKVIGKRAKSAQGEEIGRVSDLVVNPHTGETFALVDMGRRRGMAPIPWQLINMGSPEQRDLIVNKPKDVLNSAPTLTEQQWSNLNDPKFTQRIYAYYGVQPPAAMGAPGHAPEGTEQGAGGQEPSKSTNKPSDNQSPEEQPGHQHSGADKDNPQ
jgi:PRC-barrel domain